MNANQQSDSAGVHETHQRWFDGLLAEDINVLSQVLSEDVTLGFPGGNVVTRSEFLSWFERGELFYDSVDHHALKARVFGTMAVVNGQSTLAVRFQGKTFSERLTYTAVYVNEQPSWRMVAWQSTTSRK